MDKDETTEDNIPMSDDISLENEILIEFGRRAKLESTNVIKDFIKLMIPLTTGVISVYFVLLKFLGTEDIHSLTFSYGYLVPPILFLISLVTFIIASFPVPMRLDVEIMESIERFRRVALIWKFVCSLVGAVFFIAGLSGMIYVIAFYTNST